MDGEEEAHCGIVRGVALLTAKAPGRKTATNSQSAFAVLITAPRIAPATSEPGGEPLVSTPSKLLGISGSTRAWNRVRCCPMRGCKVQSQP